MKLTPKQYYSRPSPEHETGDIWMKLPTMGLLKQKTCSGIVITPSCDLSNSKVETLTYLPILPINQFLVSRSFYQIVRGELINQLKALQSSFDENLIQKNTLPNLLNIEHFRKSINDQFAEPKFEKQLLKLNAGLSWLSQIASKEQVTISSITLIEKFLGKRGPEVLTKFIRNSFSTDIHFLPSDQESLEWSPLPSHSLALFRFPITVPIEIMDYAMQPEIIQWEQTMISLEKEFACSLSFQREKPLKVLRLEPTFLSDLLTRFVSLYVRLGSPDFTDQTINDLKNEVLNEIPRNNPENR